MTAAICMLAALVQAVVGVPVGPAVQVAPIALPVGAVLGVALERAGPRGHGGEPAGIAVLVLSCVGPIAIGWCALCRDGEERTWTTTTGLKKMIFGLEYTGGNRLFQRREQWAG